MKLPYLTDVSKASIKKEIKDLRGIVANVKERVQIAIVAIVMHASEHGDCTLAVDLVNSLPNAEDKRFVTAHLRYFGGIGVDTKNGHATNAKNIDVRTNVEKISPNMTNRAGGISDIEGAKASMWFEAPESAWYRGPPRDLFVPGTIGNVGDNIVRFSEQLGKKLDGVKDRGDGREVPIFDLTDEQRTVVNKTIIGMKRLGMLLSSTENAAELRTELEQTEALIADATNVLNAIAPDAEAEAEAEVEVEVAEAVNA